MKKLLLFAVLIAGSSIEAHAANFAVITSPPTMVNLLALIIAGVAVGGSFQVLSLVRGGQLSKSWQLFTAGFAVLALSQVAKALNTFEIVAIPEYLVPTCFAVMGALFLYGVILTTRTLR